MQEANIAPLFFVHIPKTGGTSFCKAAEALFGFENCDFDYGAEAKKTSSRVRTSIYGAKDWFELSVEMRKNQSRLLAGHMPVMRYAPIFVPNRILSFVRNPVEQVLSHYSHQKRLLGYQHDLEKFCSGPQGVNLQSRMLAGVPIEALGVVGVTERQEESLQLINEVYGLSLKSLKVNGNPEKKVGESYSVDPEVRNRIEAASAADLALYQRACCLLDARLAARRNKRPFVNGAVTQVRGAQLEGFAFIAGNNTAITLRLLVDGEETATTTAINRVEQLATLGCPRKGYVGFSFTLPAWVEMGRVEVQVARTGQKLPIL